MISWRGGRVAIGDSVDGAPPLSGEQLEEGYWNALREITFGLVRRDGNSVALGPLELLRFGQARVGAHSVEWPIEGGLLAGAPGGRWRIHSDAGSLTASVDGYLPALPRPLYHVSHLQVHLLFTRLFLLRLRAGAPPGPPAAPRDRRRAAAVDVAFCLTVTRLAGFRLKPKAFLAVLAAYHVACWSTGGRTLGGAVVRQRVVATDGRPLTPAQAALRVVAIPLSWITGRPIHDRIASTEVISG